MDEEPSEEIVMAELVKPKQQPSIRWGFVLFLSFTIFSIPIWGGLVWLALQLMKVFFEFIFLL